MPTGYAFALGTCLVLVTFLVVLLRTRRLREKYAVTWIGLGIGVTIFGAFPQAVAALSSLLGVQTPSNLLFALALVVLLCVCVQLSVEITSLEEETRTVAEELALLRFDVEEFRREALEAARRVPPAGPPSAPDGPAATTPAVESTTDLAVGRARTP